MLALSDVSPSHKYLLGCEAMFGGTQHSGTALPTAPHRLWQVHELGLTATHEQSPSSCPAVPQGEQQLGQLSGSLSATAQTSSVCASRWHKALAGKSKEL